MPEMKAPETYHIEALETWNHLIDIWFDKDPSDFERLIRIAAQQSARRKRGLDLGDQAIAQAYHAGYIEGGIDTLEQLFKDKMLTAKITSTVKANPVLERILTSMYARDASIIHVDLAARLDMEYKELTDAMVHALACRAVDASGTGPNTRYSLTVCGRKFCRDVLKPNAGKTDKPEEKEP